jgi:hypothetical protein
MKSFMMMTLMLMCAALSIEAQGNRIYMEDFEISPDSTLTVSLMLANVNETRGLQFNMVLPQGLQLIDQDLTDYSYDIGMKYSIRHLAEKSTYIMVVHSMDKVCFPAGDGSAVMTFTYKAAKDFKGGIIMLNHVRGSTVDNKSITLPNDQTTVTMRPDTLMKLDNDKSTVEDQFFN